MTIWPRQEKHSGSNVDSGGPLKATEESWQDKWGNLWDRMTGRGKGPVFSQCWLENQAQENVPVRLTVVCEEARHEHFTKAWEYKMRQNTLNFEYVSIGLKPLKNTLKKITIRQPVWPELGEDLR